ncbi:hypothetical protein BKA62DRAFT_731919, partial [Auriculariales sp. MPI-PUGE-AT-0066]
MLSFEQLDIDVLGLIVDQVLQWAQQSWPENTRLRSAVRLSHISKVLRRTVMSSGAYWNYVSSLLVAAARAGNVPLVVHVGYLKLSTGDRAAFDSTLGQIISQISQLDLRAVEGWSGGDSKIALRLSPTLLRSLNISDTAVQSYVSSLVGPSMRELSLGLVTISASTLHAVLLASPNLKSLRLSDVQLIPDDGQLEADSNYRPRHLSSLELMSILEFEAAAAIIEATFPGTWKHADQILVGRRLTLGNCAKPLRFLNFPNLGTPLKLSMLSHSLELSANVDGATVRRSTSISSQMLLPGASLHHALASVLSRVAEIHIVQERVENILAVFSLTEPGMHELRVLDVSFGIAQPGAHRPWYTLPRPSARLAVPKLEHLRIRATWPFATQSVTSFALERWASDACDFLDALDPGHGTQRIIEVKCQRHDLASDQVVANALSDVFCQRH